MSVRRRGRAWWLAVSWLAAWSFAACLAIPLAGCDAPAPPDTSAPSSVPASARAEFPCRFIDITESSGVRFRHVHGGRGKKYLPETIGAGLAILDYDQDGIQDLFFVNSREWEGSAPAGGDGARCELYRGLGGGKYRDVTQESGCGVRLYGMGVAAADYDGDGDVDIFITALDGNRLLRNEGGRFEDATRTAGLDGGRSRDAAGREQPDWSTAAAWFDCDRDGDLDLFVTNYVEWRPELEVFTTMDGVTKAFTTPDRYRGLPCRLWVNDGGGRFVDRSNEAGLSGVLGKALGIALWDFDGDGLLDVAVANDTQPNFLFMNRGGGRFEEVGLRQGIAYDESGRARAGMGIDIADYAADGAPGIAIGNFSGEPISLYRWQGVQGFRSYAERCGLAAATTAPLTFGLSFLDLDLDGWQDLVIVNGHIEPDIARYQPGTTYEQGAQAFRGGAGGRFEDVSLACGPDFCRPRVGRGLAAGDLDGDGDLDLVMTVNGGSAVLLENRRGAADRAHYLRVRLVGRAPNTRALGAKVSLSAGGRTQVRYARTGSSYISQSEEILTFGLGEFERVDELRVVWPDGNATAHAVAAVDTCLVLEEPAAR